MSHWHGILIIPPDTLDIEKKATEILAHFDMNKEVEPHKEYFPMWQVNAWKKQLTTDDLAIVAKHIETSTGYGKYGEGTSLDENGLYWNTNRNSVGQWDNWCYSGGENMIG